MQRAFHYRFYPTPEQEDLLNRTFGSVRWVYNRALEERSRAWKEEQRRLVRAWTCPGCGVAHDRDVNAAPNVLAAGLAVIACGHGVSPHHAGGGRG